MKRIGMVRLQTKIVNVERIEDIKNFIDNGWTVESVDGKEIEGMCGICGLPVMVNEAHIIDSESIIWHKACDNPGTKS